MHGPSMMALVCLSVFPLPSLFFQAFRYKIIYLTLNNETVNGWHMQLYLPGPSPIMIYIWHQHIVALLALHIETSERYSHCQEVHSEIMSAGVVYHNRLAVIKDGSLIGASKKYFQDCAILPLIHHALLLLLLLPFSFVYIFFS